MSGKGTDLYNNICISKGVRLHSTVLLTQFVFHQEISDGIGPLGVNFGRHLVLLDVLKVQFVPEREFVDDVQPGAVIQGIRSEQSLIVVQLADELVVLVVRLQVHRLAIGARHQFQFGLKQTGVNVGQFLDFRCVEVPSGRILLCLWRSAFRCMICRLWTLIWRDSRSLD